MENKKKREVSVIFLLMIAMIIMTVGFAAYAANLKINGTVTVKKQNWSVHYDTDSLNEGDSTSGITATTHTLGTTDYTFAVTLNKPGDTYVAKFDVVNDGTINAKLGWDPIKLKSDMYLKKVTMTMDSAHSKYLQYTVSVNGTVYNATTDNLSVALANTTGKHPVVVTVKYLQPENATDLPSEDQTVTVSGQLDYEQAN